MGCEQLGRRGTVLSVNRLDVERNPRCDLVSDGHTCQAYVLVPYKRMERVGFYVEAAPLRLQALSEHTQGRPSAPASP